MTLSFLGRWAAIAAVAIGVGVWVGKNIPSRTAAPKRLIAQPPAGQVNASGKPLVLQFVKDPQAVPPFSVRSFSGQTLDPSAWKGKVVILNFWATWCTPCRYEIPELEDLQKHFGGSLQVIGLSVDDAPVSQVQSFVRQMDFDYPVAMANEQLQDEFGGILALPTSFVIDRNGRVVQKHVGLVPEDYYEAEIGYLAGEPVKAQVKTFVDEGQVFPSNAKHAKSLPGVDMSHLTAAQRKTALMQMNQMHCDCGCDYTVAQCRLLDPDCPNSKAMAQKVVQQVAGGAKPAATPKSAAL
jgi:thiol-disulfide isomerase/thioredoxin